MIIKAQVETPTDEEALTASKTVFDRLLGANPYSGVIFDDCLTVAQENTPAAGKPTWGAWTCPGLVR
jgi:hypothetical protein